MPVDVGLGKTSSARAAIADLVVTGGLGARKVVYAVPRHDLGAEQVTAFKGPCVLMIMEGLFARTFGICTKNPLIYLVLSQH